MKWYKHKDQLINLDLFLSIVKSENYKCKIFFYYSDKKKCITYDTEKECEEEFEKICKMLYCYERDYTSSCC